MYDYFLPPALIAQKPAVPRDNSRLFVYNTRTEEIFFDRFYHLSKYLPKQSFLVLNQTKVLPARVELKKTSGGKVIGLLLANELTNSNIIKMMVDRRVNIGEKLFLDQKNYFSVIAQDKKVFYLKFNKPWQWLINKLERIGKTPVPLYLRKTPLSEKELRKKYQTIFAGISRSPDGWQKSLGSVAAPTASLHFTNRVFKSLDKKGIKRFFVTLHVGLGTFAPLTEKNLEEKKLHEEYFAVAKKTLQSINKLKRQKKELVAVGTTVTRTLESLKLAIFNSQFSNYSGKTDLFIMPPYEFKMVDCLLTNFHLPKSSLMMLVEAFLQYKKAKKHLVELYNIAIKNNFRFYSFGDAMLIL
jgi:S-adenosylmethionine:tRNA ribosyltransferase-isomerase